MNKKLSIKCGFFLALSVLILFFDTEPLTAALIAAAVHEAGHLIAIKVLGVKKEKITVSACGMNIIYDGRYTPYFCDIIIAASGPVLNFILAGACAAIYKETGSTYVSEVMIFSAALAVFNLLPVKYFDGGKILYSVIAIILGPFPAERFISITGKLTALGILALGIFLFFESRYNFTLLLAAIWLLYVVNRE